MVKELTKNGEFFSISQNFSFIPISTGWACSVVYKMMAKYEIIIQLVILFIQALSKFFIKLYFEQWLRNQSFSSSLAHTHSIAIHEEASQPSFACSSLWVWPCRSVHSFIHLFILFYFFHIYIYFYFFSKHDLQPLKI